MRGTLDVRKGTLVLRKGYALKHVPEIVVEENGILNVEGSTNTFAAATRLVVTGQVNFAANVFKPFADGKLDIELGMGVLDNVQVEKPTFILTADDDSRMSKFTTTANSTNVFKVCVTTANVVNQHVRMGSDVLTYSAIMQVTATGACGYLFNSTTQTVYWVRTETSANTVFRGDEGARLIVQATTASVNSSDKDYLNSKIFCPVGGALSVEMNPILAGATLTFLGTAQERPLRRSRHPEGRHPRRGHHGPLAGRWP